MSKVLHVLKTDMLLWALRAFEEPPVESTYTKAIPAKLKEQILALARLPKPLPPGSLVELAGRWGHSRNSIVAMVCFSRNPEKYPGRWAA